MHVFYTIFFSLAFTILSGCKADSEDSTTSSYEACRGEYTVTDPTNGLTTARYNEYMVTSLGCVTDKLTLTTFEKQELTRYQHNITCKPQSIPSVTLVSKNNYYWPRNDSIYLDLNSQTGQFRRLIVGQTATGIPLFQREIGCWYEREDLETESVHPKNHGKQFLLDLELASSSLEVHPMEVYRYTKSGANWDTVRFDDQNGIGWDACNTEGTPWEYCTPLRNGDYFWHVGNLTSAQMDELQAEALLLRSQFNFVEISKASFEAKWISTINTSKEFGTAEAIKSNYKFQYGISGLPDIKPFVDRTWRSYLRREYPQMPDTDSVGLPLICYLGFRSIVLANGNSSVIHGEICYSGGVYQFSAN